MLDDIDLDLPMQIRSRKRYVSSIVYNMGGESSCQPGSP